MSLPNSPVLIPVSLEEIFDGFRKLVREEVRDMKTEQLRAQLLSPAEACKLFSPKISKVTLARWTKDGEIPVQRIGGRLWYKHSDLIEAGTRLKRYQQRPR